MWVTTHLISPVNEGTVPGMGLNKIAVILPLSGGFSWQIEWNFHNDLFLSVQLIQKQPRFRYWLCPEQAFKRGRVRGPPGVNICTLEYRHFSISKVSVMYQNSTISITEMEMSWCWRQSFPALELVKYPSCWRNFLQRKLWKHASSDTNFVFALTFPFMWCDDSSLFLFG